MIASSGVSRPRGRLCLDGGSYYLLGFLMCRVLAAAAAELLELETASGRLLVLRRRVVPLLAIRALQCDDFAHLSILPHRSQPASPSKTGFCRPLPLYFFPSTSGSP